MDIVEKEKRTRQRRCWGCGRPLRVFQWQFCDYCQGDFEFFLKEEEKRTKEWMKKPEAERDRLEKEWNEEIERRRKRYEEKKAQLEEKYGAMAPYHYDELEKYMEEERIRR